MTTQGISLSGDLPVAAVVVAVTLALASLVLIGWELFHHRRRALAVASTGLIATALLAAAILRPVRVRSRGTVVGPRVVILADQSASMSLPGDGTTRQLALLEAVRAMREHDPEVRWTTLGFGRGDAIPWDVGQGKALADQSRSDLVAALESLENSTEEKPSAIVLVSDGRLDRPTPDTSATLLEPRFASLGVPIHTVSVVSSAPADASIRSVETAGAAVAHQTITLTVTVGCTGGLECDKIPITVRELVEAGPPRVLGTAIATIVDDQAKVELPLTLDRAGARVVEVAIRSPKGDTIPDNDHRTLTFDVTRDRVRILHIAGRPTYDVRALREWLKSDASLDIVAFFILRSQVDDVRATPDELALIKFPVDELFSEHLPSFDAVVLQDFDAEPYGLAPYLPNLARYVTDGGGLIMVGGQTAFSAGGFAGSALEPVLPVGLPPGRSAAVIDTTPFQPRTTAVGRDTPVLEALRSLTGDELPEMSGTNVFDDAHEGTVVLWDHPTIKTSSGVPMPVLALGEHGNGRSVALSVDDTHKLAFSELASRYAGRAYGALWDGLVGWLMRDPRFEPARVELEQPCRAGQPTPVRVRTIPGMTGAMSLQIVSLGGNQPPRAVDAGPAKGTSTFRLELPPLEPGGYTVRLRFGQGPSTRHDFACERGGDEWADPRPSPELMGAIAKATKGQAVSLRDASSLRFPKAVSVSSEHHVTPLLPPWVWTVCAAVALGLHWIARRRFGLA